MAGILRRQGRSVALALAMVPGLLAGIHSPVRAQLYDQPVLVVDPDMHTAPIKALAVDAVGRLGVTGSLDKTVRVWQLADGKWYKQSESQLDQMPSDKSSRLQ